MSDRRVMTCREVIEYAPNLAADLMASLMTQTAELILTVRNLTTELNRLKVELVMLKAQHFNIARSRPPRETPGEGNPEGHHGLG